MTWTSVSFTAQKKRESPADFWYELGLATHSYTNELTEIKLPLRTYGIFLDLLRSCSFPKKFIDLEFESKH